MTDDDVRQNIMEKTDEIGQWADDAKQFVGEIGAFLHELQESGFEMPEKTAAPHRDVEKTLTDVTGSLERLKSAMAEVKQQTGS